MNTASPGCCRGSTGNRAGAAISVDLRGGPPASQCRVWIPRGSSPAGRRRSRSAGPVTAGTAMVEPSSRTTVRLAAVSKVGATPRPPPRSPDQHHLVEGPDVGRPGGAAGGQDLHRGRQRLAGGLPPSIVDVDIGGENPESFGERLQLSVVHDGTAADGPSIPSTGLLPIGHQDPTPTDDAVVGTLGSDAEVTLGSDAAAGLGSDAEVMLGSDAEGTVSFDAPSIVSGRGKGVDAVTGGDGNGGDLRPAANRPVAARGPARPAAGGCRRSARSDHRRPGPVRPGPSSIRPPPTAPAPG